MPRPQAVRVNAGLPSGSVASTSARSTLKFRRNLGAKASDSPPWVSTTGPARRRRFCTVRPVTSSKVAM